MNPALLQALLTALPVIAEEGSLRESISRQSLLDRVAELSDVDTAAPLLELLEHLLTASGVLMTEALQKGEWSFVSYPAALFARSLLASLTTGALVPAGYWEQGEFRPQDDKDQQRALLRFLELHRAKQPESAPLRFVYVAWALILLDGRILLRARDDKRRADHGAFVLPGGRLNLADLPSGEQGTTALRQIQASQSPLAIAHLTQTLRRELREETGLLEPADYRSAPLWTLPTYREVEGAGNNHALSEYHIEVHRIDLTGKGHLRLLKRIAAEPEQFTWFTPREIALQRNAAGHSAYLDALLHAYPDLVQRLEAAPSSRPEEPARWSETDAVDIPFDANMPLLIGKTGKEKSQAVPLDQEQSRLLFALAWHAKGLGLEPAPGVALLPSGWVWVQAAAPRTTLAGLVEVVNARVPGLLEMADGDLIRLARPRQLIYFPASHYRYRVDDEGHFSLSSPALPTPLGRIREQTQSTDLARNALRILESILSGEDPRDLSISDIDKTLRDQIDSRIGRDMGLRKFACVRDGVYRIDVPADM